MATRITVLGQASILIETGTIKLLCDPWFLGTSHLASWKPFPTSSALCTWQQERAQTATHIWISHAHEDHFHPETLRAIGKKPILLGNFAHEGIKREVRALASSLTLMEHAVPYHLQEMTLRTHLEQPSYRTNSLLEIETPDGRMVNANDCGLDTDTLKEISSRGTTDAFFSTLNFLANGYPFPYLSGDEPDFVERVRQVRDQVLKAFLAGAELLQPAHVFAFAGPVTLEQRLNQHLNQVAEARNWQTMIEELRQQGVPALWPAPGSVVTLFGHKATTLNLVDQPSEETASVYANDPDPSPAWNASDDRALRRFVKRRRRLARELRVQVGTTLHLHLCRTLEGVAKRRSDTSRTVSLDPQMSYVRHWAPEDEEYPYLAIYVLIDHWRAFAEERIDYDSLLLSYLIRCVRRPDVFDAALHALLRFGSDPGTQRALVQHGLHPPSGTTVGALEILLRDRTVRIDHRCPHEGAALDRALITQIDNDTCIVCPRHHWAFRLRDGACVRGDPRIKLRLLP